jgi:hypothetical protein
MSGLRMSARSPFKNIDFLANPMSASLHRLGRGWVLAVDAGSRGNTTALSVRARPLNRGSFFL